MPDREAPRPVTELWLKFQELAQCNSGEQWTPEVRDASAVAFYMGAEAVITLLQGSLDLYQTPFHLKAALEGLERDIDCVTEDEPRELNG